MGNMSEYLAEIERLQAAIRQHMDERGDDRCHLSDGILYSVLPEGDTRPARDIAVTLENCQRYITCRQQGREYIPPEQVLRALSCAGKAVVEEWGRSLFGPMQKLAQTIYALRDTVNATWGLLFPQTETIMGITADQNDPGLRTIKPDGQQEKYLVLSEEERQKGFVRPVRKTYRHVSCQRATTMSDAIAETYARDPHFYTGTYCATCREHFSLMNKDGTPAFFWVPDGSAVGL